MKKIYIFQKAILRTLVFIGLLQVCANISAEKPTIATLQEQLKSAKDDAEKIHLYFKLSDVTPSDEQRASFAEFALALARKTNDSVNISQAYRHIATARHNIEKFKQALVYAFKAEEFLTKAQLNTKDEIEVGYQIAGLYTNLGQYQEAIDYYEKIKLISIACNDSVMTAHIRSAKALAYKELGNLEKARSDYMKAWATFEAINDTVAMLGIFHNLAEIYRDLGLPDQQLEWLLKHLAYAEKTKSPTILSLSYLRLIRFFNLRGDMKTAEKYLQDLLAIPNDNDEYFENDIDVYSRANKYQILADLYFNMHNTVLAFEYQYKALEVANKEGYIKRIAQVHNSLATHYMENHLPDSAFVHAQAAYRIAATTESKRVQANAAYRLAQFYQVTKDFPKSLTYGKIAYDDAKESHYLALSCDAAKLIAGNYEKLQQFANAFQFIKEYHLLADSIASMNDYQKIAGLTSQLEYQKKESEIQSQLAVNQQKLRSQRWMNLLMAGILLLALTLAYISWKNAREKKKANDILQEHKEELETYNEELFATNEELQATNEELFNTQTELERHKDKLEEMVQEKTAELWNALIKAQESDRLKAAFLANMSHEIRTPLNAILGFLQFIDDPSMSDKREEMVILINANAHQLLTMITDIVTVSKVDSKLMELIPVKTDINVLMENVMKETQKLIQYTGKTQLELIVKNLLPSDMHTLTVDGQRIEQILLHLTDNAVKFTQKGYVFVRCQIDKNPAFLNFSVEDTGIGIAESDKELVFTRFWKHDNQSYRGVGIGLSLSEELVHLMGGAFTVESIQEAGSTFNFTVKIDGW
ncbi:MAG: tetratricopeptide repeat protein [Bacteroidales bacterium]|jgi:signal transduction histidine kinase|nr:tetratricopeptide repeat protein [Bacteroidales bacterium]